MDTKSRLRSPVSGPSRRGRRADQRLLLATPRGFEPPISSVTSWYVSPLHHGAAYPRDSRSSIPPYSRWARLSCQSFSGQRGVGLNLHLSYNAAGRDSLSSPRRGDLPKRPRSGGKRFAPRQRRKERRQPKPSQAGPSAAPTPRAAPEVPRRAEVPAGGSSVATAPTKPSTRHVARDYSYIPGELRRIIIIALVIMAGLVAAAVILR
jgi:hypothetical protein